MSTKTKGKVVPLRPEPDLRWNIEALAEAASAIQRRIQFCESDASLARSLIRTKTESLILHRAKAHATKDEIEWAQHMTKIADYEREIDRHKKTVEENNEIATGLGKCLTAVRVLLKSIRNRDAERVTRDHVRDILQANRSKYHGAGAQWTRVTKLLEEHARARQLSDVDPAHYEALVFHGAMWLKHDYHDFRRY
jgi:hypothetical protein